MLQRTELEEIARSLTAENVGHAEKLYIQDVILRRLSAETTDRLVFKGGTALLKCYQLDRFSEDLDFTARDPLDLSQLVDAAARDLERFGMPVHRQSVTNTEQSQQARLGVAGPLHTGDERSLCFVRIEVHTESSVRSVSVERYTPPFRDVPTFDLVVLEEAEILAEKIRALLSRRQPRDLYDLYHLLDRSVPVDAALVQEKLDYYDLDYDPDVVQARAETFADEWQSLEALVYGRLPAFEAVIAELDSSL